MSELELIEREKKGAERRVREAGFPVIKTLDGFDFTANPSLNKRLVMKLARCEYIRKRENAPAVGNIGTGKTHVTIAKPHNKKCALQKAKPQRQEPETTALRF